MTAASVSEKVIRLRRGKCRTGKEQTQQADQDRKKNCATGFGDTIHEARVAVNLSGIKP